VYPKKASPQIDRGHHAWHHVDAGHVVSGVNQLAHCVAANAAAAACDKDVHLFSS
jgi:hypothetical protein